MNVLGSKADQLSQIVAASATAASGRGPAPAKRQRRRSRLLNRRTLEYVVRRLLLAGATMMAASFLIFLVVRMTPGDPAKTLAGLEASEAQIAEIREDLGLDQPLVAQYVDFLRQATGGDFGDSALDGRPVTSVVSERAPATLQLAALAVMLGSAVGIAAGVAAARRQGGVLDRLVATSSAAGVAMPVYWSGLILISIFSIKLKWLPAAGREHWYSIVLPAATVALLVYAVVARLTRSAMSEALNQEYVRTARAKGTSPIRILFRHALPNCAIPIVTVLGLQLGTLLGGAVLTETVFGWPGMGQLFVSSLFQQDLPVVQGIMLYLAAIHVLINLAIDLSYLVLDPRVQYQR